MGWGCSPRGLWRTLDVLGLAEFDEAGRQQGPCKVVKQAVALLEYRSSEAAIRCRIWNVLSTDRPSGRSDLARRRGLPVQVKAAAAT